MLTCTNVGDFRLYVPGLHRTRVRRPRREARPTLLEPMSPMLGAQRTGSPLLRLGTPFRLAVEVSPLHPACENGTLLRGDLLTDPRRSGDPGGPALRANPEACCRRVNSLVGTLPSVLEKLRFGAGQIEGERGATAWPGGVSDVATIEQEETPGDVKSEPAAPLPA